MWLLYTCDYLICKEYVQKPCEYTYINIMWKIFTILQEIMYIASMWVLFSMYLTHIDTHTHTHITLQHRKKERGEEKCHLMPLKAKQSNFILQA